MNALTFAGLVGLAVVAWMARQATRGCWLRGCHDPERVPLGWRCRRCRAPLTDPHGHVSPIRKLYDRTSTTRTTAWEPASRGW